MSMQPPLPRLTGKSFRINELERDEEPSEADSPFWTRWKHHAFYVPDEPRTLKTIIVWWEKRRLFYNVVVGGLGFVTMSAYLIAVTMHFPKNLTPSYVLEGVLVCGVAANIGYCLGAASEIVLTPFTRRHRRRVAPMILRLCLYISLFVVGAPLLLLLLFIALQPYIWHI